MAWAIDYTGFSGGETGYGANIKTQKAEGGDNLLESIITAFMVNPHSGIKLIGFPLNKEGLVLVTALMDRPFYSKIGYPMPGTSHTPPSQFQEKLY